MLGPNSELAVLALFSPRLTPPAAPQPLRPVRRYAPLGLPNDKPSILSLPHRP